jgi:phosphate starvation-inducible PhoH-like protein
MPKTRQREYAAVRQSDAAWHPLDADRGQERRSAGHSHGSYQKNVKPLSEGQARLIDSLAGAQVVLALGPAGSGKTYLSVCRAVESLNAGRVERIVLTRPAVDAGEKLGYLPGDMQEKLAPFLRPLYDVLNERMGAKRVKELMAAGDIEIAPVAYMRGRTLKDAFVVVDEAQNLTFAQIKMLLTRLGHGTTMVLAGDPDQSDLPTGTSGLAEVARRFERGQVPGVDIVRLQSSDVVRHPLVAAMLPVLDSETADHDQDATAPALTSR